MVKHVSKKDLDLILQSALDYKMRDWILIKLLSGSGLRAGEIVNLKIKNINLNENELHIRGKGDKIRNVDISPVLSNLIGLWIKSSERTSNDTIFGIGYRRIHNIIKKHTDGKFTPHAFRHGYAIELLRQTKNIRYVQRQLGHANLANTQIYLQFMEYDEEKKKLSGLFETSDNN